MCVVSFIETQFWFRLWVWDNVYLKKNNLF